MKYAYEDLSDGQFESLIVILCKRLLGISVQGFSQGPDGGRDAKFVGTAELHPSKAAPWIGITIVQAKHTNGYNRHFSETDFYNPRSENSVLGGELPRVKAMRENSQLDHYMLFANRRLPGLAESEIRTYISHGTGVPESSIYLCGIEQLEAFMKEFPHVAQIADLDPVDSPLIVSPDELSEIVLALGHQWTNLSEVLDDPPVLRVKYEDKNRLNKMSDAYAKALRKRYLKDTSQIKLFLSAPENADLLRLYESVADEFELKIVSKRRDYQNFDEVMEYLTDLLFARDPILNQRAHKRLTRAMLFYMYWNCDIGKTDDVETH
jgi:hypothetical protein